MRSLVGIVAVAGSAALALLLTACGGDDDATPSAGSSVDAAALLDYLPPDPPKIGLVNLAAAREELGLPPDADVSELGTGNAQEELGVVAAATVIPYLSLPRRRPIHHAIDHGAITAAAGNLVQGGPGVAAIATSQPLDDIAERLVTEGYQRDGDVLESDSSFVQGSYSVIADAGDGVLVLGFRRDVVERTIEDSPGADNPARPLIDEVSGVTRGARATDGLACIEGVAVGQSADLEGGEIRIDVEGDASADRFRLPDALTLPEFEFGKPDAEGNVVTAEVDVDPQSGVLNGPISLLGSELAASEIYAC